MAKELIPVKINNCDLAAPASCVYRKEQTVQTDQVFGSVVLCNYRAACAYRTQVAAELPATMEAAAEPVI